MGNIRTIRKNLAQQQIAVSETKITFNGCKICLASTSPKKAIQAANDFAKFFVHIANRSRVPNMSDMYKAQLVVFDALGTDKLREIANIDNQS